MHGLDAVIPVYRRADIAMQRGEGSWLFDTSGKRYLDFATGIAVNALGHSHPALVAALQAQASQLWHCSNMYRIPEQERLAARLTNAADMDAAFFCSSGGEAVEAGLKMLRRTQHRQGRNRVITFQGGFHGRSFAGISAGGNEKARQGYAPLLPGFDQVAFGNITALEAAITPQTAGILIEPIQGEGGVYAADTVFLQDLRRLADAHGLLLMCDEVQCGMGRSGALFAYQLAGIRPDIVSVAKGIGNGFPLGATLVTRPVADAMTPGSHGSTYGSNPLAMAVGNAVLDVMLAEGFFEAVQTRSALLHAELNALVTRFPALLKAVRGVGLMIGLVTQVDNYALADRLRDAGLLTAPAAGDKVVRILPPLNVAEEEIHHAISLLQTVLKDWT